MNLTSLIHVKTIRPSTGHIRNYRKNPGDQNLAVLAAIQTARKLGESVVLVRGNSYMNVVYHIAKTTDDIGKYVPGAWPCRVLVIRTTGEIFQAMAED